MSGQRKARLGAIAVCQVLGLVLGLGPVTPGVRWVTGRPNVARAQAMPESTASRKVAVLGFDALGMEPEKVARLETLFRMELDRLTGSASPTPREIDRAMRGSTLRTCAGQTRCLVAIGKRLKVDLVVTGNVASLGDSHVINIKVVDVDKKAELDRIASDPLRGDPDELITAVRVAAYRLLAPEQLLGAISILSDTPGAQVTLDGQAIGKTPLLRPLDNLALGKHSIAISADGYDTFTRDVEVRFQKTTTVLVRMQPGAVYREDLTATGQSAAVSSSRPFYQKTWFLVGVGVAAVVVGGVVGFSLARDEVIDCGASPGMCQ